MSTNIFDQLEAYKQHNPDVEEAMCLYLEVMPIYHETMQVLRKIELAIHPHKITTRTNTALEQEQQA